jgi:hypothetical protein
MKSDARWRALITMAATAILLYQHRFVNRRTGGAFNRCKVQAWPLCGQLHAIGRTCSQILYEVIDIVGIAHTNRAISLVSAHRAVLVGSSPQACKPLSSGTPFDEEPIDVRLLRLLDQASKTARAPHAGTLIFCHRRLYFATIGHILLKTRQHNAHRQAKHARGLGGP